MVAAILLAIWTVPWKGLALWRSAKRGDRIWFIILLLINTLGVLEIIYLLFFSKEKQKEAEGLSNFQPPKKFI